MKRYFNTTGYCNPEWHYMVDTLQEIKPEIDSLIENKQYFLIHAPRQTGKTTLLHAMARQINKEGKYIAVTFSVERAGFKKIPHDDANYYMISSLYMASEVFLPENERPAYYENYKGKSFFEYISTWCKAQKKSIVLFCDEVDSLFDEIMISLLRQFRDGFQYRPELFPRSLALVGLRDIRDYKMKIKEQNGALGSGSPFNIKAKSFRLGGFSKEQIAGLYRQHTEETGQAFNAEVIDLIYEYTGGQPWLVNAIANEIVVEILKRNYKAEITIEIVETAKENLIKRRDTHLDSLMDKLQLDRVKHIIQEIISGELSPGDNNKTYNDDLLYTIDLGIVKDTENGIVIANKIYSEIIVRVLNKSMQDRLKPQYQPQWFIKEGSLQMDLLLKEYQQFYRENAESWIDRFYYKECGQQLLLMAFLQRIINGGGRIDREMTLGKGSTDLMIEFGGERFVLELKIKRSNYNHKKALGQLSRYLDHTGQKHGYLILFEEKLSKEISWEERIKWEDVEHEWMGVKRKITIVEM